MVELLSSAGPITVPAKTKMLLPVGSDDPLAAGGPYYPLPGDVVNLSFTWRSSGAAFTGYGWWQKGLTPISAPAIAGIDYRSASVGVNASTQTATLTVPSSYDRVDPWYFLVENDSATYSIYINSATMTGPERQAPEQPGGANGEDDGDGNGPESTVDPAVARVADFLGQTDSAFLALAQESVTVITAMVHAYTRGNGFSKPPSADETPQPNNELAAVITTASARLVANPEQIPTDVGTVSTRGGFSGFSLAETFVLNRYRVTAR